MAVKLSVSEVETSLNYAPPAPKAEADALVLLEHHGLGAAVAAAGRKYQKPLIVPAVVVALLGLGLSVALFAKIKHRSHAPIGLIETSGKESRSGPRHSNTSTEVFPDNGVERLNPLTVERQTSERKENDDSVLSYTAEQPFDETLPHAPLTHAVPKKRLPLPLPSIQELESSLSDTQKAGKTYVAHIAGKVRQNVPEPNVRTKDKLGGLAELLTDQKSDEIIGVTFSLENLRPMNPAFAQEAPSGLFHVTKYLGQGGSNIVLEVINQQTRKPYAMVVRTHSRRKEASWEETVELMKNDLNHEEDTMLKACGSSTPGQAAEERGIAIPHFIGDIAGLQDMNLSSYTYFFRRVHLMERLEGDMGTIIQTSQLTPAAKEYIAKRLLLQVLLLQEAGISHNDLKWRNFFLRGDGSFLIGDWGSGSPFGELMFPLAGITPAYVEPNLLMDYYGRPLDVPATRPDRKSDMWSLGSLLFELFTNGSLPYNIAPSINYLAATYLKLEKLLASDASPDTLEKELEMFRTPKRWQQLIKQLLEPKRENRISADDVARDFSDLLGGPGG